MAFIIFACELEVLIVQHFRGCCLLSNIVDERIAFLGDAQYACILSSVEGIVGATIPKTSTCIHFLLLSQVPLFFCCYVCAFGKPDHTGETRRSSTCATISLFSFQSEMKGFVMYRVQLLQ